MGWFSLNTIAERDPDAARDIWREIAAAARDELASGHRTAAARDWDGRPWERARFLAIRTSFRDDDRPRPGLEAAMVDMAAEAFASWLQLREHFQMMDGTEADLERVTLDRNGKWKPPHDTTADHTARMEQMAERAHARFLRTVKALTDLRRAGPVSVGQAGQVNVASQQVNVARPAAEGDECGPQRSEAGAPFPVRFRFATQAYCPPASAISPQRPAIWPDRRRIARTPGARFADNC